MRISYEKICCNVIVIRDLDTDSHITLDYDPRQDMFDFWGIKSYTRYFSHNGRCYDRTKSGNWRHYNNMLAYFRPYMDKAYDLL